MTTFNLDPASARVAEVVGTWVSNNEAAEQAAVGACVEAITQHSGTGNQAELYEQAFREHGGEYQRYCETAGSYVRDRLLEHIGYTGSDQGLAYGILADLLDLSDLMVWAEIADTFMPDPELVYQEWDADDEDSGNHCERCGVDIPVWDTYCERHAAEEEL